VKIARLAIFRAKSRQNHVLVLFHVKHSPPRLRIRNCFQKRIRRTFSPVHAKVARSDPAGKSCKNHRKSPKIVKTGHESHDFFTFFTRFTTKDCIPPLAPGGKHWPQKSRMSHSASPKNQLEKDSLEMSPHLSAASRTTRSVPTLFKLTPTTRLANRRQSGYDDDTLALKLPI
jgi:hypothetical protein